MNQIQQQIYKENKQQDISLQQKHRISDTIGNNQRAKSALSAVVGTTAINLFCVVNKIVSGTCFGLLAISSIFMTCFIASMWMRKMLSPLNTFYLYAHMSIQPIIYLSLPIWFMLCMLTMPKLAKKANFAELIQLAGSALSYTLVFLFF